MNIIANLTAKQKAVIRRDFLIDNFKGAYGNNATATLLLDFARKHMPDTLAEIESGYNEVYEKRHKRIEERKAALLAKERQTKPEETAEAENTQPTAEVQPEEHTQTEERNVRTANITTVQQCPEQDCAMRHRHVPLPRRFVSTDCFLRRNGKTSRIARPEKNSATLQGDSRRSGCLF